MTSNDKALRRYCRQVSKYLVCKPQTKERLISGLQQELTDNGLAGSGYPEIVSNYGDPKAVAACLMEAVSDDEFSEADKRQKDVPSGFLLLQLCCWLRLSVGTCITLLTGSNALRMNSSCRTFRKVLFRQIILQMI